MTREDELEKLKAFIGDGTYILECLEDGWQESSANIDSLEDVLDVLKSGNYRVVKVFNSIDIFGI